MSSMRGAGGAASKPLQKWKVDDAAANRNGAHHTCFFVKTGKKGLTAKGEYQGSWADNKRHGFGVSTTAKGKYEGMWAHGVKEGEGTQWVKRGGDLKKQYFGGWMGGKRHGRGTFFYPNGDKYEGMWEEGLRAGEGVMYYANGDVYHGDWVAGQRSGVGVLTLANGDSFEGGWHKDLKHGPGRFIYLSKGRMYEGEWVLDVAKCGVLGPLPTDGGGQGSDPTLRVEELPELGLAAPHQVVASAIEAARTGGMQDLPGAVTSATGEEVGAAPAAPPPAAGAWWLPLGLTDEDVVELEDAFLAAGPDADTYAVPLERFGLVLDALGLAPTPHEVAALVDEMGLPPGATAVPFEAFVVCMAQHKDGGGEEA
ncbi:morn3 [Symbiodinium sp. KB8]|nr:morn3 [Symbiodinium sp. KB8]